ncbi:MAG: aminotransferase class III-fold pyridoxal phosphate-dependent enzyme, partial [Thermoleophilum sp.]|nr:aminotransferase class III-fold pyridoxal phosphate-dependent enzyme [Thermoleophilum sp.]
MVDNALGWMAGAALAAIPLGWQRLRLSRAKHPSLAGHQRWAKRLARWLPGYALHAPQAFACDGAPPAVLQLRQAGWRALGERLRAAAPCTLALTAQAREGMPDLRLTGRYRVPYAFAELARELPIGAFWARSEGPWLIDLDDNRFLDLTGSYGVNVLGLDFYKGTIEAGAHLGAALGPVLGGLHTCVADNVARLRAISGMDDVTFHMSGTEAVMQAVRLARYHTGRRYVVRFAGAYHGWWEDVQPGPGNPLPPRETYTLAEMSEATLAVLRTRRDIACVLVNPLQALHPNRAAPSDSTLVGGTRQAGFDRAAYTRWLQRLREVCTQAGIALIFDEVFVGFRLASGGAQAYFGVQADLVCYGKTLGGGLPVGVVCGKRHWMERYRPQRPADLAGARRRHPGRPCQHALNARGFIFQIPVVAQERIRNARSPDRLLGGLVRRSQEQLAPASVRQARVGDELHAGARGRFRRVRMLANSRLVVSVRGDDQKAVDPGKRRIQRVRTVEVSLPDVDSPGAKVFRLLGMAHA